MRLEYPEGATPIDPEELASLIPSLTTQAELNEFEALNIAEAVDWAYRSRIVKRGVLDRDVLSLLHKRMFDKTWLWAGKYRQTAKNLGMETWCIPAEIQTLVIDTRHWIEHTTYDPNELIARFHHRLVSIHPFLNGNGRHARLAADLLCPQIGCPLPTWGSSDQSNSTDVRSKYINALRRADCHEMQSLVKFLRS